jgi:hypothetical protein
MNYNWLNEAVIPAFYAYRFAEEMTRGAFESLTLLSDQITGRISYIGRDICRRGVGRVASRRAAEAKPNVLQKNTNLSALCQDSP